MMKTRIVRAVDSGNIQRSPIFQAVFSHFFSGPDKLPFPVVFDSAGIDVDSIMADRTPVTRQLEIIGTGMHYGLIDCDKERLAAELLGLWSDKSDVQIPDMDKRRITGLYSEVKTGVHILQMRFRNDALLEAGIPPEFLPGMRVPFRHDDGLALILPVEESVAGKIDEYYGSINRRRPALKVYGDLAGMDPLNDELTGGMETARKQVRYFMDSRDRVIIEILKLIDEDSSIVNIHEVCHDKGQDQ